MDGEAETHIKHNTDTQHFIINSGKCLIETALFGLMLETTEEPYSVFPPF